MTDPSCPHRSKRFDMVRGTLRRKHGSYHTEQTDVDRKGRSSLDLEK